MRIFFIVLLFISTFSKAATNTFTVATGNWNNSGNWSLARLPIAGDLIVIPAGRVLNVNTNVDLAAGVSTTIIINGTLHFATSDKLALATGSGIQINPGGRMTGDEGDASQKITFGVAPTVVEQWRSKCNGGKVPPQCGDVTGPLTYGDPLPVKLITFSVAEPENAQVILSWKTSEEINFNHFEIEKGEEAGDWKYVTTVYPNSTGEYNYIDEQSVERYYRLKMVDHDGTFEVSPIINFQKQIEGKVIADENGVSVYTKEAGVVTIYNLLGGKIREIQVEEGIYKIELPSGIFHISLNHSSLGKFVVN